MFRSGRPFFAIRLSWATAVTGDFRHHFFELTGFLAANRGFFGIALQAALVGFKKRLGPRIVQALRDAPTPIRLGNAGRTPQAVLHDPDLLRRRVSFRLAQRSVLDEPDRSGVMAIGLRSCLHSGVVAIGPKPTLPPVVRSVSLALMPETIGRNLTGSGTAQKSGMTTTYCEAEPQSQYRSSRGCEVE